MWKKIAKGQKKIEEKGKGKGSRRKKKQMNLEESQIKKTNVQKISINISRVYNEEK